jgi:hypothetical protein
LTGHDPASLDAALDDGVTKEQFFAEAPRMNPVRDRVRGMICGVRIEEIAEPPMREIGVFDKVVEELAKGRPVAKVLRLTCRVGGRIAHPTRGVSCRDQRSP